MEPWLESFARANFRRSADTAHDLKTPLNVAVLNLELLRMRLRKLTGEDDEKVLGYTQAIETELRRLGRIFDAFFLLSTPPKSEGEPADVDVAAIAAEVFQIPANGAALLRAHESRIRQAVKLFSDGATHVLAGENRQVRAEQDGERFSITIAGSPVAPELEMTKIFKFYYTDPLGNPDLSLAVARLIAETYGGELSAVEEAGSERITLRLSFPLGAK